MAQFNVMGFALENVTVVPTQLGGASINEITDFTEGWEGGLSDDPRDNASKYPCPASYTIVKKGKPYTSNKWHTNKGVTWQTFTGNASLLGYTATPALFFQMPKSLWLKIAKRRYWDVIYLDSYKSQAIANVMFSWMWGSGYAWRPSMIAYLKTKGITWNKNDYKALATHLNGLAVKNERKTFTELIQLKLAYLKKLDDWPTYGTGWTNRLNDLEKKSLKFITENPKSTGGALFFLIVTVVAIAKRKKIAAFIEKHKPKSKS